MNTQAVTTVSAPALSSIIHYGITPKSNQTVSKTLSDLGISLMKTSPSDLQPHVILSNPQANHPVYERYLSVFVRAAGLNKSYRVSDPYHAFTGTIPTFFNPPLIIFSFEIAKIDETKAAYIRTEYNASECLVQGKPAFTMAFNIEKLRALTSEPSLITTTPCSSTAVNINSARQYLLALKMIDGILKANQYAHSPDNEDLNPAEDGPNEEFDLRVVYHHGTDVEMAEGSETHAHDNEIVVHSSKVYAHNNTGGTFHTFDYSVSSPAHLPSDHHGLIFPYIAELAQPDRRIAAYFFRTYMFHGFGSTCEAATESYELFKSGIGNVSMTPAGLELAHILTTLDITLKAQCTSRLMVDAQGRYQGMVILGGGYRLRIGDKVHIPQSPEILRRDYNSASPHISALTTIFGRLSYATEEIRQANLQMCSTIQMLRAGLMVASLTEEDRGVIMRAATRLSFGMDPPYLSITAHNIALLLEAIANPSIPITHLPLHPGYLLSTNRMEVLWSAFGPIAPSFRVPGGKSMSLSADFSTERKGKGGVIEKVPVRRISILLSPLETALTHLKTVREDRTILNPAGNAVVNRVSSDSLIKSFEKDQADNLLGALRKFAAVSVVNSEGAGTSSGKKRKADGDLGGDSKRVALDF